ncbi:unnamed protein product [Chironomus riparius]|uniref:RRM domain-containing protein n=1 Tax=Chironomus riparius TaxID=315576 RepID=A0A9N9RSR1_9DIPT|nr:unnamed protein product [Chironomus riparius]
MLDVSASTVKTEEADHESSGSENSSYSETNFEEKLEELETKVMRLIEFVINDINQLKKTSRKKLVKRQESDKENIEQDRWKCRIYVGNIHPLTSIETLRDYFSKCCGEVVNAYFFRTFPTCQNAFVEFKSPLFVEKALKQQHCLSKRGLTVGPAKRRNDNSLKELQSFKAKNTDFKVLRYRPY